MMLFSNELGAFSLKSTSVSIEMIHSSGSFSNEVEQINSSHKVHLNITDQILDITSNHLEQRKISLCEINYAIYLFIRISINSK